MSVGAQLAWVATKSPQILFVALLLLGGVVIVRPEIGRWLDQIAPIALVNEKTITTTTTAAVGSAPANVTTVETHERTPFVDGGLLGVVLSVPGLLFFLRIGVIALIAMIGAAVMQAATQGRFNFEFGGLRVNADAVAATVENATRSVIKLEEQRASATAPAVQERAPSEPPVPGYIWAIAANAAQATIAAERTARKKRYESVEDPDLAIAALRVDLEQTLRVLAERNGVDRKSVGDVVSELRRRGIITADLARDIERLLDFGNQAAHGARFNPAALGNIRRSGIELLAALDKLAASGPAPSTAE